MQRLMLFCFISGFISACSAGRFEVVKYQTDIHWLNQADPVADAQAAIVQNELSLLVFDQRGMKIPGISHNQYSFAKNNCKLVWLHSMGDTIKDREELNRMKQLRKYVLAYNTEIAKSTNCHQQES